MLAELATGLSSVQALAKIAQGLNALSTQAQVNEVKIGLQNHILAVQTALSAAQLAEMRAAERIRELEQRILSFEDWETEKQRYVSMAVAPGAFAYVVKSGMEGSEPPHWLCAACFTKRQKSFLQSRGNEDPKTGRRGNYAQWVCLSCKGEITVPYARNPTNMGDASAPPPEGPKPPPSATWGSVNRG